MKLTGKKGFTTMEYTLLLALLLLAAVGAWSAFGPPAREARQRQLQKQVQAQTQKEVQQSLVEQMNASPEERSEKMLGATRGILERAGLKMVGTSADGLDCWKDDKGNLYFVDFVRPEYGGEIVVSVWGPISLAASIQEESSQEEFSSVEP